MNQKRSRFRQVENTRNLPEPARASKNPSALEVLRLWILDETPVCVLRLGQDPVRSWGLLLAEVARTVGKAAFDTKGIDSRETIATLQTVFNNFLEEPAAVPAGTFAVLPLQDGENVETINEDVDPARNHERASSAGQTLEFYSRLVNEDMSAGFWPAIVDLMADIGHFCDEHDLDFHDLKAMASEHHQIESGRIYDGPTDSSALEDSASNVAARCGAGRSRPRGWACRKSAGRGITVNKDRSEFQNAMYAPPSSVANAKKVIEYYAELNSVSAKEYDLDSLLVSLLIDLDEFCGYEHDLDLAEFLSSARQHIACERENLQSRTNCVLCNQSLVAGGDNWCDLCPGCADHVSKYMDEQDLHGRIGRAKAISHMSQQ